MCCNRDVAAANTSALFNLATAADSKPNHVVDMPITMDNPSAKSIIVSGQLLQDALSRHYGNAELSTLAEGIKHYRKVLPPGTIKNMEELNAAASYSKNHGAVISTRLVDEVVNNFHTLPCGTSCPGNKDGGVHEPIASVFNSNVDESASQEVEDKHIANHSRFAYAASAPARLDTGTKHFSFDVGSIVEVRNLKKKPGPSE